MGSAISCSLSWLAPLTSLISKGSGFSCSTPDWDENLLQHNLAEKSLKSRPNFCSMHTKLLKTTFKTLLFSFFIQEMWQATMSKINLWQLTSAGLIWGLKEKKTPQIKPPKGVQNISKWPLQSAESAQREDGGIYMDFWEHILHNPRVLQARFKHWGI